MSRKEKILSRVSLCHHMMLSCDANLCKRYEAIICYDICVIIDKHCCSYFVNDQLVINCNDSRHSCLMLIIV